MRCACQVFGFPGAQGCRSVSLLPLARILPTTLVSVTTSARLPCTVKTRRMALPARPVHLQPSAMSRCDRPRCRCRCARESARAPCPVLRTRSGHLRSTHRGFADGDDATPPGHRARPPLRLAAPGGVEAHEPTAARSTGLTQQGVEVSHHRTNRRGRRSHRGQSLRLHGYEPTRSAAALRARIPQLGGDQPLRLEPLQRRVDVRPAHGPPRAVLNVVCDRYRVRFRWAETHAASITSSSNSATDSFVMAFAGNRVTK